MEQVDLVNVCAMDNSHLFLQRSFIEHCYKQEVIGKESLDVEVIWEKLYNKSRPFGQQGIALNSL